MKKRYPNPNLAKINHNYTLKEAAKILGKHKNTVSAWIKEEGLPVVSGSKHPILILGNELRTFLQKKRTKNKQPCKPDELYCFKCRVPRKPEAGLVDYVPVTKKIANLIAICPACDTYMNRRVSMAKLPIICEKLGIRLPLAQRRIGESDSPSVNSDFERLNRP